MAKIVVVKVVVTGGRSLVRLTLGNIKLANYEDGVIVAVVLIDI